jgi:hypothetical protein
LIAAFNVRSWFSPLFFPWCFILLFSKQNKNKKQKKKFKRFPPPSRVWRKSRGKKSETEKKKLRDLPNPRWRRGEFEFSILKTGKIFFSYQCYVGERIQLQQPENGINRTKTTGDNWNLRTIGTTGVQLVNTGTTGTTESTHLTTGMTRNNWCDCHDWNHQSNRNDWNNQNNRNNRNDWNDRNG